MINEILAIITVVCLSLSISIIGYTWCIDDLKSKIIFISSNTIMCSVLIIKIITGVLK